MSLIFACQDVPPGSWIGAIKSAMPDLDIHIWPDHGEADAVEFALIWGPHAGEMSQFPNLKAMISIGAGVDHILDQPSRPLHVPVVRLVDPGLKFGMVEFVVYNVLRYHRRMPEYALQQDKGLWIERAQTLPSDRRVGILGLGEIGTACASALARMRFDVVGWSRSKKEVLDVGCFYGDEMLTAFLGQSEILICILPLTVETHGILNKQTLSALPAGAYVINVGRGGHVVEQDLLDALNSGHISGAALDVFDTEPLPQDHPFWSHSNVTVTPHIAALTMPQTAVPVIVDIIKNIRAGRPIPGEVDPSQGY